MEKIATQNFIGNSESLIAKYPNRQKFCVSCKTPYFVSLKKAIGKSKYCSKKCSDKNQKRGYWNKGKSPSVETRTKLSKSAKGDKSYLWKGGITKTNALIRAGLEYRLWREQVFKRDNYTCQQCGLRGVYLEADHVKSFAMFPKLRFELSNGRTLCRECHKKTDTYLAKGRWKK